MKKVRQWKFLRLNGVLNRKFKVSDQGDIVLSNGMKPLKQYDMGKKSPKNGSDYKSINLWDEESSTTRVHRIICETFHGPAPEGKNVVNHIDEHKNNNKASNLEWVSPSENSQSYYDNNGITRHSKLRIIQVKKLINRGWTNTRIAQKTHMSDTNVSLIKHGHIHKNVKPLTEFQ